MNGSGKLVLDPKMGAIYKPKVNERDHENVVAQCRTNMQAGHAQP